jgi:hypothetical protein
MSLEQRAALGEEIESALAEELTPEVLARPSLQAAFDDVESQITEAWKNAPIRDLEGQQELKRWLTVTRKIREHLESVAQDGRLAKLELEKRRNPMQRALDTTLERLGIR